MAYSGYRRNLNRSRRTFKRVYGRKGLPWYKRKYNAMELAGKAWSGVKAIRHLVNSEKLHLVTTSSTGISNTGSVAIFNNIAQGDSISGRTGNSILMSDVLLRYECVINSSAASTLVRVIVFIDTEQVGDTNPAVSDVLQSVSTLAGLNKNQPGRFSVLYDRLVSLNSNGTQSFNDKWYLKNMDIHAKYNGTTANDINKNGIYLLLISDQATNTPTVSTNLTLGYYDN